MCMMKYMGWKIQGKDKDLNILEWWHGVQFPSYLNSICTKEKLFDGHFFIFTCDSLFLPTYKNTSLRILVNSIFRQSERGQSGFGLINGSHCLAGRKIIRIPCMNFPSSSFLPLDNYHIQSALNCMYFNAAFVFSLPLFWHLLPHSKD